MNWFKNLFSSEVSGVIDSIGKVIDDTCTSDEERLTIKNQMQGILNNFETRQLEHTEKMEEEVSSRHEEDMKSDSWLSKNIRPITLAYLTFATSILAFWTIFTDLTTLQIQSLGMWIGLLTTLLLTVYGFYFGGRTLEKMSGLATNLKTKLTKKKEK